MVFAEVEARAIANELAAQAKVGDFEPGFEAGGGEDRSVCRSGTRRFGSGCGRGHSA